MGLLSGHLAGSLTFLFCLNCFRHYIIIYLPIGTLNCTLEELALLELIVKNPTAKQQEFADALDKSLRTTKRLMKSLQDKNYIRRESGKRYGTWKILI